MDIGGSLIKLVYFSPGEDEDGESSEALGSDEYESSIPSPVAVAQSETQSSSFPVHQQPTVQPQGLSNASSTASLTGPGATEGTPPPEIAEPRRKARFDQQREAPGTSGSSQDNAGTEEAAQDELFRSVAESNGGAKLHQSVADLRTAAILQRDSVGASSDKASRGGRLHFVKFETARIDDAIAFIKQKHLHCTRSGGSDAGPLLQVRPALHATTTCSVPRCLLGGRGRQCEV
jgi:hypothetical protein